MHTTFVIIHVVAMVASLGLMSSAVALGLFGKRIAAMVANLGLLATVFGGLSGIILLVSAPLSMECVVLTAYLAGVTVLHVFGFAVGDADRARLIRSTGK